MCMNQREVDPVHPVLLHLGELNKHTKFKYNFDCRGTTAVCENVEFGLEERMLQHPA